MRRTGVLASFSLAFVALGCGGRSSLLESLGGGAGVCDPGKQRSCYTGPAGTEGVGVCKGGVEVCSATGWGSCMGEVLPSPQTCTGLDNECDGIVDEGCACEVGQQQACYTGPAGTEGVGPCKAGTQTCSLMGWGPCVGEVLPQPSECGVVDNNCDGSTTGITCPDGTTCGTSFTFANPPELWTLNGIASYQPGGAGVPPLVQLSGQDDKAGTLIYTNPIATDTFTVTFMSNPIGDGVAFMLETTGPTALGGANGGFGMSGLTGYGFELDAFQNDCGGDPPAPHVGVDDLSHACGTANSVLTSMITAQVNDPKVMNGNPVPIEIEFSQGTVTMIVDGTTLISGFSIPGFPVGQQFYYGFGSSDGFSGGNVSVEDIEVTFPTPRCL